MRRFRSLIRPRGEHLAHQTAWIHTIIGVDFERQRISPALSEADIFW